MKHIIFLILLSCISCYGQFSFIENKTLNGSLSDQFLQNLTHAFPDIEIFFETGTYNAQTTINAAKYFKKVYTVELSPSLHAQAKYILAPHSNVSLVYGTSYETILKIAPTLNKKILFWLDAHYSGGNTAMTYNNPHAANALTPIREELEAIKNCGLTDSIIIIDDFREFGNIINNIEYLGCWAYPSANEIKKLLLDINPEFTLILSGDQLIAYDKNKYLPSFSATVLACTKTRFYDGYNLTDMELYDHEQMIINASVHEQQFISHIYKHMSKLEYPMFWNDLWYGLVQLGAKNYQEAHQALIKVPQRKQWYTKLHEYSLITIPCNHPHINTYIETCTSNLNN